ncbi:Protein phosphatase PrpC [subsurface metagenome]
MQLVQSGVIEEKDIRTHPLRNRITKCLGSMNNQEADITWFDIEDGDVLLLCSDGLWEMIHDELIYAIISTSNDPANICKKLIDAANNAGGVDNITAIIAQFTKE